MEVDIKNKKFLLVQPATPDFLEIDKVCLRCLQEQVPTPDEEIAKETIFQLRRSQFKVLYDGQNKIAGLIYFTIRDELDDIHIDFICSVEKRMGIGRFLINNIAEWGKENRFGKLSLEVSALDGGALSFYRSIGFYEVGEISRNIKLKKMEYKL